jgi:uncharacterized protein YlxW (UPF0749 family)
MKLEERMDKYLVESKPVNKIAAEIKKYNKKKAEVKTERKKLERKLDDIIKSYTKMRASGDITDYEFNDVMGDISTQMSYL